MISFADAVNDGLATALDQDRKVIVYGLGVDDPKGVFGTTLGLKSRFGGERVFDMPTSENAMTGVGIGASLLGFRPVLTHQRLDFALLSMDQLVNNAAKWRFMFGGQRSASIVVRMIIGRGWGQGPTHSQNLQAWFAHIPGLKVVMPSFPDDAKGLLLSAIFDDDPVIFLEHRWLHNMKGEVPSGDVRVPIGVARIVKPGRDVTVVSMSYMTIEAIHALESLEAHDINPEIIDLRTVRPIDWATIYGSVRKTGRLLVLDTATMTGSIAGEVVARVSSDCWTDLKAAPRRLAMPDAPEATSPSLTSAYHIRAEHVASEIGRMLGAEVDLSALVASRTMPHDVPGQWFTGPF